MNTHWSEVGGRCPALRRRRYFWAPTANLSVALVYCYQRKARSALHEVLCGNFQEYSILRARVRLRLGPQSGKEQGEDLCSSKGESCKCEIDVTSSIKRFGVAAGDSVHDVENGSGKWW